MAYQHFFSRVPARCSMYKRTDEYDTFIKSAEIDKAFIDKELAPVIEYKTTKYEAGLIRDGKLPPAYTQHFGKNGEMIHSAISYIPRDFTGERSSYMVHSLILTDAEKLFVSSTVDRKTLNEKMFVTDIDTFHVASPKATPIAEYPSIDYVSEKTNPTKVLVDAYAPRVVKHLIYALIAAACGKGKPVYITMGCPIEELSSSALDLMNTVLLLFPFNLRRNLSFITYQSDYSKFGAFKVHFLPSDCMAIPTGKGYLFDMTPKLASGIRDEEYAAMEGVIEFFYRIASDNRLRTTFLKYYQGVLESDPSLEIPTLKNLTAMVTLFRQISGVYSEKALLPDDAKVYDMITVYEKYRNALRPSERCIIYECLRRYPKNHTVIPNNIFSKVSKLYPTEPAKTKNTVMEIMLELMHFDIMRDKLFAFVKANYAKESPKNRAEISENLARVYYGGFLQPQILAFFAQNFKNEAESTRDLILEKLLLSIRTASIQDKILEFLASYYDIFTDGQKKAFYKTVYEMLPECDSLTVKLIGFMNRFTEKEPEALRTAIADKLISIAEADQRKQEHRLVSLYLADSGFCRHVILDPIFTKWTGRRVFDEFFTLLFTKDVTETGKMLVDLFTSAPYLQASTEKKLESHLAEGMPAILQKAGLYRLIDMENLFNERLVGQLNENVDAFVARFKENLLNPAIVNSLWDAFRPGPVEDPIGFVTEYAVTHSFVKGSEPYLQVERYGRIGRQYMGGFVKEMIHDFLLLPSEKPLSVYIAKGFEKIVDNSKGDMILVKEKAIVMAVALLLCGYLQNKMSMEKTYDTLYDLYATRFSADPATSKPEVFKEHATLASLDVLLSAVTTLYQSEMPEEGKAVLTRSFAEDGEMLPVMKRALPNLSRASRKSVQNLISNIKQEAPDLASFVAGEFSAAVKASDGSVVSRVLSAVTGFFGTVGSFFASIPQKVKKIFKK